MYFTCIELVNELGHYHFRYHSILDASRRQRRTLSLRNLPLREGGSVTAGRAGDSALCAYDSAKLGSAYKEEEIGKRKVKKEKASRQS